MKMEGQFPMVRRGIPISPSIRRSILAQCRKGLQYRKVAEAHRTTVFTVMGIAHKAGHRRYRPRHPMDAKMRRALLRGYHQGRPEGEVIREIRATWYSAPQACREAGIARWRLSREELEAVWRLTEWGFSPRKVARRLGRPLGKINVELARGKRRPVRGFLPVDEEMRQHPDFPAYWVTDRGRVLAQSGLRVMLPFEDSHGWRRLKLFDRRGRIRYAGVHRLVGELFLDPPPPGEGRARVTRKLGRTTDRAADLVWVRARGRRHVAG